MQFYSIFERNFVSVVPDINNYIKIGDSNEYK